MPKWHLKSSWLILTQDESPVVSLHFFSDNSLTLILPRLYLVLNSSDHLMTNLSPPHTTCWYTLSLIAGTWCHLPLTHTHAHTDKVSWSCSWSVSGTQIQHPWLHSWIKDKCDHFLNTIYTITLLFASALLYSKWSIKASWPWGVSPYTPLLILLKYSALHLMNGHCRSSNTCPAVDEKHSHTYRMKAHSQIQRLFLVYTTIGTHVPEDILRAYAETCTHLRKQSLMNIHAH